MCLCVCVNEQGTCQCFNWITISYALTKPQGLEAAPCNLAPSGNKPFTTSPLKAPLGAFRTVWVWSISRWMSSGVIFKNVWLHYYYYYYLASCKHDTWQKRGREHLRESRWSACIPLNLAWCPPCWGSGLGHLRRHGHDKSVKLRTVHLTVTFCMCYLIWIIGNGSRLPFGLTPPDNRLERCTTFCELLRQCDVAWYKTLKKRTGVSVVLAC